MNAELIKQFIETLIKLSKTQTQECLNNTSKGELAVLAFLVFEHDKVTPSELRTNFNVSSGRMADTLKTLEQKGYVHRKTDEKDKRRTLVSYTKKGKEYTTENYKKLVNNINKMFDSIGEHDARELIRIINKITIYAKVQEVKE